MTGPRDQRPEHTCTKHEPGQRTCYTTHGCKCRQCTDAATATARRYKWVHGHGHSTKVPGEPVRAHLAKLRAAGMSTAEIAQVSGVAPASFRNVEAGRVCDVQRRTAAALLAAKPVPIEQQRVGFVDGTGTRRRLQALAAIGWAGPALGARLGLSRAHVRAIIRSDGQLSADLRARVMALYDDLWCEPQTGTAALRARRAAQRRGWVLPLAWDDDQGPHGIDNPAAKPHTQGRLRVADKSALTLADAERMIGTDSATRIARQFGYGKPASFARWLRRQGRDDLANRIERKAA